MTDRINRKGLDKIDIVIFIVLTLLALLIFYPFYNAVLTSLVSAKTYTVSPAMLYPPEIKWDNFRYMLDSPILWTGYASTLIITVCGTVYGMTVSVMMAYAFSRRYFPGKKLLFRLMLFTLFFNGGLIPTYLLIKNLGLIDTRTGVILLLGVAPFNIILIKSSFEQTPVSLEEAARIDGANDITIFRRIMLPLQLPVIATFSLFTAVGYWNEWFWSMLIINSRDKMTLQLVLRAIVNEASGDVQVMSSVSAEGVFSQGVKMAAVVATMLPIMLVYPFLQKYFVKGILVGAIKM